MTTETPNNPMPKIEFPGERPVPAQGRSVLGSAVLLLVAIAIIGGAAWWAIPRLCALVGGISESSRMGLWLCAAALVHGLCMRRK